MGDAADDPVSDAVNDSVDAVEVRQPPGAPPVAAYLLALAVYIVLGYFLRSVVLNWIIGPVFLLIALYLLPRLVRSSPSKHAG